MSAFAGREGNINFMENPFKVDQQTSRMFAKFYHFSRENSMGNLILKYQSFTFCTTLHCRSNLNPGMFPCSPGGWSIIGRFPPRHLPVITLFISLHPTSSSPSTPPHLFILIIHQDVFCSSLIDGNKKVMYQLSSQQSGLSGGDGVSAGGQVCRYTTMEQP